ncbi:MAG TPA: hypothetical protein VN605_05185, partial [Thermoanaerobaculia bacterium]|nr:hypothetical protein [Thermoanaerobaculia bacterium]
MKRLGLATLLLIAAASLQAQMPANFERGFAPEKLYQFGDLDHVNLFNGNLVITLPMGESYPIGAGSSFQLTLVYNSTIWEYMEVSPITQQSKPPEPWGYPTRRSNAGLGWTLSVGRIFDETSGTLYPGTSYESPDGNDHRIRAVSNPTPNVAVTNDSSYLRWHTDTFLIDSPDGSTRQFFLDPALRAKNGYGWLRRLEDPFLNYVLVDQFFNAPGGMLSQWRITDNVGRTHNVYFKNFAGTSSIPATAQTNYKTVVDRIELQTAGGTATYTFHYANNEGVADQSTAVSEGCSGGAEGWPHTYNLLILRSITLPDGSSYAMDYKTGTQSLESCDPGQIRSLTLPTLGKVSWRYGSYLFPIQSCTDSLWMSGNNGVIERTFTDPTNSDTTLAAWTYTPALLSDLTNVCNVGETGRSRTHPYAQEMTNTVTFPGGRKDVNHFSVYNGDVNYPSGYTAPHLSKWEYASPQCRVNRDATGKRGLSVETFDCSSGTCGAQPVRKKFIRYVFDGTTLDSSGKIDEDPASHEPLISNDFNPRTDSQRTLFDNGGSAVDPSRYLDEDQSGFDGFGHYRTVTTYGSFDSIGSRTTLTNYNPGTDVRGFLGSSYKFGSTDPWVLNTYDRTSITAGNHSAATEACFDLTTGFLLRTRTLADDPAAPAVPSEGAADLI